MTNFLIFNINEDKRIEIIILIFYLRQMSSGNCFEKNCSGNCCDYYGNCPNPCSSSLYQNQCWYYYSTKATTTCQGVACSSAGSLIGGIVGGVVGLIIIIVIIVACYRKYKANQTVNNQITPNQCG